MEEQMELVKQVSCEVEEVLAHTSLELLQKIPPEVRKFFKEHSEDVEHYVTKYDANIPLEKQDLLEETKGILSWFYRDYWCTEEEKQETEKIWYQNEEAYQEELRKKYKVDVFQKDEKEILKELDNLPEIVEKKWYTRLFEKIKSFFFRK